MKSQKEKAVEFRNLHHGDHILILPNAWDIPSARIFEDAGFRAVATTSAGLSVSLGYPDGELISRDEMLGTVRRIANVLSVPLSVDIEAGFGANEEVVKTVRGVISAGAVGINIEDTTKGKERQLEDTDVQVRKIRAIRSVADSMDVPLVINARTDAFLLARGENLDRLRETIHRAEIYGEAGADCVFPFFVKDTESISTIIRAVRYPINILVGQGVPTIPELESLGVARVSIGPGAICAGFGLMRRIAKELLESGTYYTITEGAISYVELNRLAMPK